MRKVCPHCGKMVECTNLKNFEDDFRVLKYVWRCEKGHDFESDTIAKQVAGPVLGLVGLFFGISKGS